MNAVTLRNLSEISVVPGGRPEQGEIFAAGGWDFRGRFRMTDGAARPALALTLAAGARSLGFLPRIRGRCLALFGSA
ncbi:MAG: Hypothetical protein C75L2_00430012 [Leptospirillum sp. Group II 'C75']|uniref:Uncharacterized protein n=1 Tax=Leptospirillum sp. Group II '5-way CG' TaxID=419541 RepID=B6ARY5_9BACT|nr:hypothetical protein [Leptospirillum sp. Group II 'CF-1']EAY57031.1 MAG: hypothetical protein UBAL2_80490313 [Leptospirillum rubarum]EDZ38231.1 MAG: Hypothetical protein CGL2_10601007 [Leptospirillum sp. Group II '5-way CG']EIJ75223.1 MAG: Hypothetical protein C75L2_00430012 [Leptospirillum sp. Group II 'C75']